jgi:hypothetical protein
MTDWRASDAWQPDGGGAAGAASDELDRELLRGLFADYGADVIAEIVADLPEEVAGSFAVLRVAAGDADAPAAERALHALKGTALGLGLMGFARACETGERAARAGRAPGMAEVDALAAHWERAYAHFEAFDPAA